MVKIYCYVLVSDSGEHLYYGISNNPARRESEHRREGKKFKSLRKLSSHKNRELAHFAEGKRIATYMKRHNGDLPYYNRTTLGDRL